MSENNHIQDMMLRYLNGESTGEETKVLQEWISKSTSNAEEFEITKRLWADSGEAALINVNTEKAWQSVSSKTIKKQAKVVSLFPWKKTLTIAASLILIVSVLYYFNQPPEITWNVRLAQNSNKTFQLSDGTMITLRKGSRLSVPENYGREARRVKLDGEAYFVVEHDGQNPFTITTSKSIIKDVGTAFLVQSMDTLEQVTVLEGVVSIAKIKNEKNPLILTAGESVVLKNEKLMLKKVDTGNLLSWSSKILIFRNTPLSMVVEDLKNYYRIDALLPKKLDSIQITAEFRNEPLSQVLKELHLFTGLHYQIKEGRLLISK